MALVKDGNVAADLWTHLSDDDVIPANGAITVSWERWQKDRDALSRNPAQLGLRVPNTVAPSDIGADAAQCSLIVLNFPKFGDGRAYSQARVLRERFAFKGELRATGDVLRDQLLFMQRCGFNAFEVPEKAIEENWIAALDEFTNFYQAGLENRPWIARQRLAASGGS